MRKIFVLLFLLMLIFPLVSASEMMIAPPPSEGLGINQYYAINFDEEGDAEIAAKIQFNMLTDDEIKELKIEVPGNQLRMISIVQEYHEQDKRCNRYDEDEKCINYYNYRTQKYAAVDYTEERLSNSVLYTIKLEKPLDMESGGSLLLYYKSPSYIEKHFDIFEFAFETVKLQYDTRNARVAVTVSPDLVLAGGDAKVNYQPSVFGMAEKTMGVADSGVQSESMRSFSNQINYARGYVKEARSLDPKESFTVEGKYAKSWIALHWIGVLTTVIILALLAVGVKLLWMKKFKKMKSVMVKNIALGFGSSVAITILFLITKFGLDNLRRIVGWQYYELLSIMLVLIVGFIILLLLFTPAIYMGIKHGFLNGIWTMAITMVCLLFIVIILVAIFGIMNISSGPVYTSRVF